MVSPDDTQPRSPFKVQPAMQGEPELMEGDAGNRGPGCMMWALVGLVIMGFGVVIVALSAFAGWSSGQRIAQSNATATQNAAINEQLSRLPADVTNRNMALLNARLRYLATLTPGVAGLEAFVVTATALYQESQPTATSTPSPTVTPGPTAEATRETPPVTLTGDSRYDLAGLLQEARAAVTVRDWDSAIDALDVMLAADAGYETSVVRDLMLEALTEKALELLRYGDSSDLAEGILLADRARSFGDIGELGYEAYIAGLYLDAVNTAGIDFSAAIQALLQVYNAVPGYRDVGQRLFNQYVAYGDAWVAQGEFCPAVGPYQNALGLFGDASVSAKRDNATTMCAQATPIGAPAGTLEPGQQPVAPVGVGG